jgi:hypothetical protein
MAGFRQIRKALIKYYEPLLSADNIETFQLRGEMLDIRPVRAAIKQLWYSIAPDAAERMYRQTMKLSGLKFGTYSEDWIKLLQEFLGDHGLEDLTTQLTRSTRNWLIRNIEEATIQGYGIEWLKNKLLKEFTATRARTIARTETIRARNAAHMTAGKELPFQATKVWLSARDNRTRGNNPKVKRPRADHFHMNEQGKEVNEPFEDPISKALMMFPGDSTGQNVKGSDVINCRCRVVFEPKRDANGLPIMK